MIGTIRRWFKARSLIRHLQILSAGTLIFIVFWSLGQITDQPFGVFAKLSWLVLGVLMVYIVLLAIFNPNGEEPAQNQ